MSRFRVLQFNMQFGQVWDPADPDAAPVQIERTLDAIREVDADIVLLQELEHVGVGGVRPEPPSNYEFLKRALPAYSSVFSYPPFDPAELPFGIGLAIFCKTQLTDFERWVLPAADISFLFNGKRTRPTERIAIAATTRIGSRPVRILNTHLQAYFMIGGNSNQYPCQRDRIAELLAASGPASLIGGDFNLGPDEDLIAQYQKIGYEPVQTSTVTWKRRPYVTDHIFHGAALRCVSSSVLPTAASDHERLVAEFECV